MDYLIGLDTQLFRWINGHYCDAMDWIMWVVSQHWFFAVVLVFLFVLLTLRREPRSWWVVGIGIALCFLLSDRVSVLCFKDVVCRLRPCHVLDNVHMFRTHCGGQYGFVSSHAANVFALAMFFALRYRHIGCEDGQGGWWQRHGVTVAVMLWGVVVCYSRVYLGKHYPGDCLCGTLVGLAMGALVFYVLERLPWTRSSRVNKKQ